MESPAHSSCGPNLVIRGFRLTPWRHDLLMRRFVYGPFDGLLDMRDRVRLIAVATDRPGTGKLPELFAALEAAADEVGFAIEVVPIWNGRLLRWLMRRGYAHDVTGEGDLRATRAKR